MAFSIGMLFVCLPFSDPSPTIQVAPACTPACLSSMDSGTPVQTLQLVNPWVSCAVAAGAVRNAPVGPEGALSALHSRNRILGRSPEAEVAVVSRRRRIVQPHGAQAGRTLESGALAVSMQIFGARFGFFGPCILSARGLYCSNSQAG